MERKRKRVERMKELSASTAERERENCNQLDECFLFCAQLLHP